LRFDTLNIALSYGIRSIASGIFIIDNFGHEITTSFRSIIATTKFQNFSEESVNLRLFPFSLHDKATKWLDFLASGSITSWEELLKQFYHRFFLMSRVNEARKEISSFTKDEDEKFTECWTRFKDMLMKCPPHGYEK
jgi:hypothetical protein